MLSEAELVSSEDHFYPSVRLIEVERTDNTTFGFHLTRGKWDPYPWVSKIDCGSAADEAGMRAGDCLLEVNGEDVVGRRISEIAQIVKMNQQVTLLVWNAGSDAQCSPETLCCGPMPNNFQRLSAATSSILNHLECPVCLDTTQPPVYQCDNGHIICMRCRARSERCPVCRIRYSRGRSLIADNVYNSIMDAFDLRNISQEIRTVKINDIFKPKDKAANKSNTTLPDIKITQHHAHNKFLARLIGKASSVENLSSKGNSNGRILNQLVVDSEFSTNTLKTKSLSSNEIFRPAVSPGISRTSSINAINNMNAMNICTRCSSVDSISDNTGSDDGALFICPFNNECSVLFKASQISQHFQSIHDGPLIQYFKPKLTIKLSAEGQSTYLITLDEKQFVLKILQETNDSVSNHKNLRIWVWFLGNKKQAAEYQLHVNLFDENQKNAAILSTHSPIYSLNSVTWADVKDSKKAVFLNASTLKASNASNIFVEAEIFKCEGLNM